MNDTLMLGIWTISGLVLGGILLYYNLVTRLYYPYFESLTTEEYTATRAIDNLVGDSSRKELSIERISEPLKQRYEIETNTIYLLDPQGRSVGDIATATHEGIHYLQHHNNTVFFAVHQKISPLGKLLGQSFFPLIIGGFIAVPALIPAAILIYLLSTIMGLTGLLLEIKTSTEAYLFLRANKVLSPAKLNSAWKFYMWAGSGHLLSVLVAPLQPLKTILLHSG